jgi:hypothetical protein
MSEFERLGDRNQSLEFGRRTLKNLDFIVHAREDEKDVHAVIQSINSLLGLLIFPFERSAIDSLKNERVPDLSSQGWPKWRMTGIRVPKLGDLVTLLRHSTAHGNIQFDSDDPRPERVNVTFTNYPKGQSQENWSGSIGGDDLITFCRRFTSALIDRLG